MTRLTSLAVCIALSAITGCNSSPSGSGPESATKPHSASATSQGAAGMPHVPENLIEWSRGARLYEGLGSFHRPITTSSKEAQRYFDQGMRFMWAFNHDEAARSFAEAAQLDPGCGMCYWGVALTVGPNYNLPFMAKPRAQVAFAALGEARKTAARATPVERALVAALARRYPNAQPLDPTNEGPVLTAYADAMRSVAAQFPADLDVQTMYAESRMDLNAWKLWTPDGRPAPGTVEILATLQGVLQRDPDHPGANHYYVHAIEASPHPERGLVSAERLRGMMPAAGHLEHMPAHIFQRVGRYEDASDANRRGILADTKYLATTQPPDYYAMYVAHNYQFLAYSAAMEGRKAETLEAARKLRAAVPEQTLLAMPGLDWYLVEYYQAFLRFGLWDRMLAETAPDPRLPCLSAGYWYARGVASAATGRLPQAKDALRRLEKIAADTPADYGAGNNTARDVFALAVSALRGQIAAAEHDGDSAVALLTEAAAKEDHLAYDEPSAWFFPVRHVLGAQLLQLGKAREAEAVYRQDLAHNPDNGWSLDGLARSLQAQKKETQAASVRERFRKAWVHADITLTASR